MGKRELLWIAAILIAASAVFYEIHYLIFGDVHHIFIYMVGDIAFVPLEVLLVTLIVDRVLASREKRNRQHKLNMVIGAFFSAVGQEALRLMGELATDREEIAYHLAVQADWSPQQMREAEEWAQGRTFRIEPKPAVLERLAELLIKERDFMLRLLENPLLLEHETFTDVLWSLFHFEEELAAREDFHSLPQSDLEHLSGDAERAYTHLLLQWVEYMMHLKEAYPYLFSLAVRMNPIHGEAQPYVYE